MSNTYINTAAYILDGDQYPQYSYSPNGMCIYDSHRVTKKDLIVTCGYTDFSIPLTAVRQIFNDVMVKTMS